MIRIRQLALWLPVFDQLMTLTYSTPDSKSLSKKSDNVTAEDGKVNTTLPATSPENREIYVTVSSGKAEREVNDIMENRTNKRHEPIVVFIGHSDSEALGIKINHLNFQNLLPCPSLVCTLKSVHQKDEKTMTLCFLAILTNMFQ